MDLEGQIAVVIKKYAANGAILDLIDAKGPKWKDPALDCWDIERGTGYKNEPRFIVSSSVRAALGMAAKECIRN
jgi:hypothetical protein